MSLHEKSTVGFGEASDVEYVEALESQIGGSWNKVDNAQAFQCDLGYEMCSILVEHNGNAWVGKISSVNPPVNESTEECADLSAAMLKLRVLIRDHGLLLKERGAELVELVTGNAG